MFGVLSVLALLATLVVAATLGPVGSTPRTGNLDGRSGAVLVAQQVPADVCDANGVSVSYTSNYTAVGSSSTFRVQSVQVGGIDSVQCAQLGIAVKLRHGTTVIATGGPVPITGPNASVPFASPPPTSAVDGVTVEIQVLVPSACAGISFSGYVIGGVGVKETLTGGPGNNLLLARGSDVKLVGGPGRDCLVGGPGINDLNGAAGDDVLIGGTGRNSFNGSSGTDRCIAGGAPNKYQGCEQVTP